MKKQYFKNLAFILEHDLKEIGMDHLTFSVEADEQQRERRAADDAPADARQPELGAATAYTGSGRRLAGYAGAEGQRVAAPAAGAGRAPPMRAPRKPASSITFHAFKL